MNFKKVVASLLLMTSLTVSVSQGCLAAGATGKNYSCTNSQSKDKSPTRKSFIKKAGQVAKVAAGVGITYCVIFSGREKQIGHVIKGVKSLSGDVVKLANFANKNLTVPGKIATLGTTSVGAYVIGRQAVRAMSLLVKGINKANEELICKPVAVVKNDATKMVNAVRSVKDKVTGNKKQKDSKKKDEPKGLKEINIREDCKVNVKITSGRDDLKNNESNNDVKSSAFTNDKKQVDNDVKTNTSNIDNE